MSRAPNLTEKRSAIRQTAGTQQGKITCQMLLRYFCQGGVPTAAASHDGHIPYPCMFVYSVCIVQPSFTSKTPEFSCRKDSDDIYYSLTDSPAP